MWMVEQIKIDWPRGNPRQSSLAHSQQRVNVAEKAKSTQLTHNISRTSHSLDSAAIFIYVHVQLFSCFNYNLAAGCYPCEISLKANPILASAPKWSEPMQPSEAPC